MHYTPLLLKLLAYFLEIICVPLSCWIFVFFVWISKEAEDDGDSLGVDDDDLEDFAKFSSATPGGGSGPSGAGGDGENVSEDAVEDEDDLLGA